MTLLGDVVGVLVRDRIPFALIGAAAMAAHGVSRATLDVDLLTIDQRVLESARWIGVPGVDIRRGDPDDPLAGVVRVVAGPSAVDVVVGRSAWQARILEDAQPVEFEGVELPVADLPGLILLKLYAGGPQDAWDIEQLLRAAGRPEVEDEVAARLGGLPRGARDLWARVSARHD